MTIQDVKHVCVVGAGAMGRQIALNTAIHGYEVALYDVSRQALDDARAWTDEYLAGRVAKGRLSQEQVDQARARLDPGRLGEQAGGAQDEVVRVARERSRKWAAQFQS